MTSPARAYYASLNATSLPSVPSCPNCPQEEETNVNKHIRLLLDIIIAGLTIIRFSGLIVFHTANVLSYISGTIAGEASRAIRLLR